DARGRGRRSMTKLKKAHAASVLGALLTAIAACCCDEAPPLAVRLGGTAGSGAGTGTGGAGGHAGAGGGGWGWGGAGGGGGAGARGGHGGTGGGRRGGGDLQRGGTGGAVGRDLGDGVGGGIDHDDLLGDGVVGRAGGRRVEQRLRGDRGRSPAGGPEDRGRQR